MGEILTYDTWNGNKFDVFVDSESKGALDVLRWAFKQYDNELVYACSFGAEGVVLIDMISRVYPQAKIVFLDTGLHFKKTYELIDKVKSQYPDLQIEMISPELSVDEQAQQYGDKLWEQDPNRCCYLRKVAPLEQALSGHRGWISGLRREQSPTRKYTEFIDRDEKFEMIKVCPLIHWSWKDVWRYIKDNNLPYNVLHDEGYPSIGCENCTLPTENGSDLRAGRWTNLKKTECGLHLT